ncbi:MAG: hypothetical protein LBQ75_06690 [Zoogloeaceae bacterium]|jgi:hypothetical protein|nr:hypothetical protein [Zoogloeaceae bacterium]
MQVTAEFTLRHCSETGTKAHPIPQSEILVKGKPTGTIIEGLLLEAAVAWQDKTLLFVTHDCLYEEQLDLLLVDATHNVMDMASIALMYTPGIFGDMELIEPNTVRFTFFGDDLWEVRLLAQPRIRVPFMPLLSEPYCVRRPFGFSRHFIAQEKLDCVGYPLGWRPSSARE